MEIGGSFPNREATWPLAIERLCGKSTASSDCVVKSQKLLSLFSGGDWKGCGQRGWCPPTTTLPGQHVCHAKWEAEANASQGRTKWPGGEGGS